MNFGLRGQRHSGQRSMQELEINVNLTKKKIHTVKFLLRLCQCLCGESAQQLVSIPPKMERNPNIALKTWSGHLATARRDAQDHMTSSLQVKTKRFAPPSCLTWGGRGGVSRDDAIRQRPLVCFTPFNGDTPKAQLHFVSKTSRSIVLILPKHRANN